MDKSYKEIIFIVIILIVVIWLMSSTFEGFTILGGDAAISDVSYPVYYQRFGLRGEPWRTSNIDNWYRSDNRQIMLSHAGGEMWESNRTPIDERFTGCTKVPCSSYIYDNQDTCWQCGYDRGVNVPGVSFPLMCPY